MKVKYVGETKFPSLTYNKVYEVVSILYGWYRVVDDSDNDSFYKNEDFVIAEGSEDELREAGKIIDEENPDSDDEDNDKDEGVFHEDLVNALLESIARQIEAATGDAKAAQIVRDAKTDSVR